jgi:hypothetical protein
LAYAAALGTSLWLATGTLWRKFYPRTTDWLLVIGMWCFFFCDVNVAFFNALGEGKPLFHGAFPILGTPIGTPTGTAPGLATTVAAPTGAGAPSVGLLVPYTLRDIVGTLVWLFYLPAQLLLALSGYRVDFLRSLYPALPDLPEPDRRPRPAEKGVQRVKLTPQVLASAHERDQGLNADRVILHGTWYHELFGHTLHERDYLPWKRGIVRIRCGSRTIWRMYAGPGEDALPHLTKDGIGLTRESLMMLGIRPDGEPVELELHGSNGPFRKWAYHWYHPVHNVRIGFKLGVFYALLGVIFTVIWEMRH